LTCGSSFQTITNAKPLSLYKEKFVVQVRHQWIPINTADIAFFMKETLNYLVTFSGDKYIMSFETLDEIEEVLNPEIFYRANRQFIVNVNAVNSMIPKENSKLTVHLKAPLKAAIDISRDKAPEFRKVAGPIRPCLPLTATL
jgi:DNA-binding LytR/AlgR family response regulator